MSTHVYARSGKFKNVNCGYALADGIVFASVFDAEEYCTEMGLDANTTIEADGPEALNKCKAVARVCLPVLRRIQEQQRKTWYGEISEDVHKKVRDRDAAAEKKELGWEVYQDWVLEAVGISRGYGMALQDINKQIATLERVCRISGK